MSRMWYTLLMEEIRIHRNGQTVVGFISGTGVVVNGDSFDTVWKELIEIKDQKETENEVSKDYS